MTGQQGPKHRQRRAARSLFFDEDEFPPLTTVSNYESRSAMDSKGPEQPRVREVRDHMSDDGSAFSDASHRTQRVHMVTAPAPSDGEDVGEAERRGSSDLQHAKRHASGTNTEETVKHDRNEVNDIKDQQLQCSVQQRCIYR